MTHLLVRVNTNLESSQYLMRFHNFASDKSVKEHSTIDVILSTKLLRH